MLLQQHWRLTSRATGWCPTSATARLEGTLGIETHTRVGTELTGGHLCSSYMCRPCPRAAQTASASLKVSLRFHLHFSSVCTVLGTWHCLLKAPSLRQHHRTRLPQPLETPQRGALSSAKLVSSNPQSLGSSTSGGSQLPEESLDLPTGTRGSHLFAPAPNPCHFISPLLGHESQGPLASPALPHSTLCFVGPFMFRWIPPTLETWPKFCLLQEAFPAYLIPSPLLWPPTSQYSPGAGLSLRTVWQIQSCPWETSVSSADPRICKTVPC